MLTTKLFKMQLIIHDVNQIHVETRCYTLRVWNQNEKKLTNLEIKLSKQLFLDNFLGHASI